MTASVASPPGAWPSLPLAEWADTYATLHLWTQIVGKIRLAQSPWVNHSWHVALYVTATGLTTSSIPYGDRAFQIDFDFVDHVLRVRTSDGGRAGFALEPQSVATFHRRLFAELSRLDLRVEIHGKPNEIPDAIPPPASQPRPSLPKEPPTAPICASSSCRTTSCVKRSRPTPRCWRSCSRRTRPPRISRAGIDAHSNVTAIRSAETTRAPPQAFRSGRTAHRSVPSCARGRRSRPRRRRRRRPTPRARRDR